MSLVCSDRETVMVGKTSEKTDRFLGKIARLIPNSLVIWTTVIDPADPAFAVEMTIRTHLRPTPDGTEVTMVARHIPAATRLEDNKMNCRQTLEQLAA